MYEYESYLGDVPIVVQYEVAGDEAIIESITVDGNELPITDLSAIALDTLKVRCERDYFEETDEGRASVAAYWAKERALDERSRLGALV